jgi:ferredoxin
VSDELAVGALIAVVDRAECFGFGYCVELLPAVFSLDGEGRSVAAHVLADPEHLAAAVDSCPRAAIRLVPSSPAPADPA